MIYCISILKIPVIKLYIDIHLESKSYFLNVIHKYLRVMLSRMKLVTHYVFTTGLLTAISSPFLGFYTALTLSFIISWISNTLIDRLGHEVRGGYIRRTPRTHTLFRSLPWGLIPAVPLALLEGYVVLVLLGLVAGPSHLLLDLFTERGIYVRQGRRWTRFALAHFPYDSIFVNGLAILAGSALLYMALLSQLHSALPFHLLSHVNFGQD
ncbi:MAG: hypothetical protein MjAS7_2600 [Metallosphaera javensis (ex Sakai et al. 2022)]|nr:MAG: hypothetical protein MjAS7_2600 [Metallosphaera javensis (ex Sakai et al. 2022)]